MQQKYSHLLPLLLLAGLLATPPLQGQETNTSSQATDPAVFAQMELLADVLLQVRKNYVEEKTYEELLQGAIRGMLGELDPHSTFLDEAEYTQLKDDTSGSYGGIGIQIGMRDNILTVIAPIEDTPAFRAGLQSGDRILRIDGETTSGMTLRDAVKVLRGPEGESVRLTISAEGTAEEHDVEIVRDRIQVDSVKGARMLRPGIGYVRLTQFDAPAAENLAKALHTLQEEGLQALILDLRSNPGGLLEQAIKVADLFLEPAKTIVSTQGRGRSGREIPFESAGGPFADLPLAVLINGGSASASEIVAGAMQDHNRGILIGDTTYGKGSVQSVIRMGEDDDAAIRLTTAYYYTPGHRLIHDIGIEPDIAVPLDREAWRRVQIRRSHIENPESYAPEDVESYQDVIDPQLERAVDLLDAVLIYQTRFDT